MAHTPLQKPSQKVSLASLVQITIAVVLILAGIAGLILPIIPGWVLIIAGIIVLNRHTNIIYLKRFEKFLRDKFKDAVREYRKHVIKKKQIKIKKIEKKINLLEQKIKKPRKD
jgi:uncharacterized membrane protein YbaN (DUF454 family)